MKLRRGLAAGAGIFSAVALGLALESGDPASAVAPPADGTYTFNQAGRVRGDLDDLSAVRSGQRKPVLQGLFQPGHHGGFLRFERGELNGRTNQSPGQAAELRRKSPAGQRTVDLQGRQGDGVSCPGGGTGASTETYAFDNETLAGTHTSLHGAVCGLQPAMSKQPFSLQLDGPPPSPIERYPLRCNDLAMCF